MSRLPQTGSTVMAHNLGPCHALVVDDMVVPRMILAGRLRALGLLVDTAQNGQIALDRIAEGDIDMVFMDLDMPEMDGLTAITILRGQAIGRDLPIYAYTTRDDPDTLAKVVQAGANGMLPKRANTDDIVALLGPCFMGQSLIA